MSQVQYTLVQNEDGAAILVFVQGHAPLAATDDHPNFAKIVELTQAKDPAVVDLFDVAATVEQSFARFGNGRITVENGAVYLDGDPLTGTLTEHILRTLSEGGDVEPLVKFYENLLANPNTHSIENLYRWIDAMGEGFSITPDGMIVGYKGVKVTDKGFASVNQGKAKVNGKVFNGAIPNNVGDIVEMPRSEVEFNPSVGCSRGLHVGTYAYAKNWSQGAVLEVHVNPADVVSVPSDCSDAKMRTCRYVVIDAIDQPYTQAVVRKPTETVVVSDWGDSDDDAPIAKPKGKGAQVTVAGVTIGDKFLDADTRGATRTLEVLGFTPDKTKAITLSSTGVHRNIKLSRLNRNKYYRRVK